MSKPMMRSNPAAAEARPPPPTPPPRARGGAREDRILALEAPRVGEPAVRLHEQQPHAFQLAGHMLHVAAKERLEVGVHHRGVAAPDELHERADAMRNGYLREPEFRRESGNPLFVLRISIPMHEHDRSEERRVGKEGRSR